MSGTISETGNRKPENSAEALEKYIDSKIPRNLRENFSRDISMIKAGWDEAARFFLTLRSQSGAEDQVRTVRDLVRRLRDQFGWNHADDCGFSLDDHAECVCGQPEYEELLQCIEDAGSFAAKWRREPPDESGLWWWWNEDEDSSPIPITISLTGGSNPSIYFANSGQWGWNRFQLVTEMGGLWMRCIEPTVPSSQERDRLIAESKVGDHGLEAPPPGMRWVPRSDRPGEFGLAKME